MTKAILACLLLVPLAAPALAQDPEPARSPLLQLVFGWLPFLLIIAIWLWFMRRIGTKRVGLQVTRSLEHMDAMERKTDEMLETLKRIEEGVRR